MPVAPYDPYAPVNPWWRQQQQAPQQGVPFSQPPAPEQPKQWWQGLPGPKSTDQSANSPKQPSLYDMMLNLGRMSRPQYDQAVKGAGPAAMASPWAWLGSMGMPGGAGWGGGGTPG